MASTRRIPAALVLCLLSLVALPSAAGAHQSPAGCTTSALQERFTGLESIKRNGDVIRIQPTVRNDTNAMACDWTDVTFTVEFPKPDGTAGGPVKTVATDIDVPAGTTPIDLPDIEHTLDFDPGVFRGPVKLSAAGTGHFGASDIVSTGSFSTNVVISRPHAIVDVTPNPLMGDAPLNVSYTYKVTNDSPADPNTTNPTPRLFNAQLSDDTCSPLSAPTGDAGAQNEIDAGETWTYTCSRLFQAGTYTNKATVTGDSSRDGRPWPATSGQSTVTVNGPDMTLAKSHAGSFRQGDRGRTYTLVARNSGSAAATGAVSVADQLPAGLTARAIAGLGWTCDLAALSCSRGDALAGGASYPPITVTVDVAANAPARVVNTAKVSRAGQNDANDEATDPTAIGRKAATPPVKPGAGGTPPRVDDTPADRTAPVLGSARLRARKVRAGRRNAFVYALSEPGSVRIAIQRRKGRRWVKAGTIRHNGVAGTNRKPWSGKLGGRKLRPGTYRAVLTATDGAGNRSAAKRLRFKVVRR